MNNKLNYVIGNNVRSLRKNAGMTQQQLADKMNINRVSICNIECGTHGVTIENLCTLRRIFDCSFDNLIPREIPFNNSEIPFPIFPPLKPAYIK